MSYHRKGENRPALTGRTARRADQRCQARTTARKHGHRVITHVDRAVAVASRAGYLMAGDYLAGLGVDARYAASFGAAVHDAFVANHGAEPDRGAWSIVNGRMRATYRYTNELDVIAGALAYPRTADLILTLPGHPVARQFASV